MSEQSGRNEQSNPGTDWLADLQRWLIRSSAKNMRRELEGQVRRTLGGQRRDPGEVWDVATTEIPPEVGEAPECQWCPICRAARRMRESGPGLGGPLSGAGEAVATVAQDAISMLESLLARSGGNRAGTSGGTSGGANAGRPGGPPGQSGPTSRQRNANTADGLASRSASRPDSLAGEHGPSGWKPGDRLATAGIGVTDPWASATEASATETLAAEVPAADVPAAEVPAAEAEDTTDGANAASQDEGQDGRGHGPSDRS